MEQPIQGMRAEISGSESCSRVVVGRVVVWSLVVGRVVVGRVVVWSTDTLQYNENRAKAKTAPFASSTATAMAI